MTHAATPVLRMRHLAVEHAGRPAAAMPALDVEPGEVVALVGENGVGKSSLLRAAALLAPIAGGELSVTGETAAAAGAARRRQRTRVTLVLPTPYLFACSVRRNVERGLAARGVERRARRTRARTVLAELGAEHLGKRDARSLSTGEAARVALARALVLDTPLLLLDEPFANLDRAGVALARKALEARAAAGVGVVVSALRLEDLEGLAARVVPVERPTPAVRPV